jgi:hypothetical protein
MPPQNPPSAAGKNHRGFRISNGAVLSLAGNERADFSPEAVELPRFYGPPLLFGIARDPRTIFTYWSIDWPSIFENTAPVARQVHLRVYRENGGEETNAAVEPMAGNCYLTVSRPRATYRVEIGFYQPENVWHIVAISDEVTMPPASVAENVDVDLATIPFHLSFQRLIDLFRASSGEALSEIISRLQKRAVTDEEHDLLNPEELEILRAMNLSLDETAHAREIFNTPANAAALRRRAEAILGFGSSSPAHGFGASSWS